MHPSRAVVVIAGPSGSGKSRLAGRLARAYGWPVVRLDDFYKDGDDPSLPLLPGGLPDWDDPQSWRLPAAVDALTNLTRQGVTTVPSYDIASSTARGSSRISAEPGQWVLAEGIFAAHVVRPLGEQGVLTAAYCVCTNRWVTFVRRLVRDLIERRKPPLVLVRRGLRLCRAEPRIVAEQVALGARRASPAQVECDLAARTRARTVERRRNRPRAR